MHEVIYMMSCCGIGCNGYGEEGTVVVVMVVIVMVVVIVMYRHHHGFGYFEYNNDHYYHHYHHQAHHQGVYDHAVRWSPLVLLLVPLKRPMAVVRVTEEAIHPAIDQNRALRVAYDNDHHSA